MIDEEEPKAKPQPERPDVDAVFERLTESDRGSRTASDDPQT